MNRTVILLMVSAVTISALAGVTGTTTSTSSTTTPPPTWRTLLVIAPTTNVYFSAPIEQGALATSTVNVRGSMSSTDISRIKTAVANAAAATSTWSGDGVRMTVARTTTLSSSITKIRTDSTYCRGIDGAHARSLIKADALAKGYDLSTFDVVFVVWITDEYVAGTNVRDVFWAYDPERQIPMCYGAEMDLPYDGVPAMADFPLPLAHSTWGDPYPGDGHPSAVFMHEWLHAANDFAWRRGASTQWMPDVHSNASFVGHSQAKPYTNSSETWMYWYRDLMSGKLKPTSSPTTTYVYGMTPARWSKIGTPTRPAPMPTL